MQPSSPQQEANGEATASGARIPAPAGEPDPAEHSTADSAEDGAPAEEGTARADEHSGRDSQQTRTAESARGGTAPGGTGGQGSGSQGGGKAQPRGGKTAQSAAQGKSGRQTGGSGAQRRGRSAPRRPSGRERHDEKITVYVSAEELMDLEHARLVLRGEHGLAVDRGRIVREAVAVVLADLESRGDASILVRRLRGR